MKLDNQIQYLPKNIDAESLAKIVETYGDAIEAIYPLSPGQAWMLEETKTVTDAFFLQSVFRAELAVRPEFAEKWLKQTIAKRPNLRTAFAWRGLKTPFQVVLKQREPEFTWIDRSDKGIEELSEELDAFCAADRARGFDLERDTLVRAAIMEAKNNAYAVVVSRPHLIDDGESDAILGRELFFDRLLKGKLRPAQTENASYQAYAKWLEERDRETDLRYWKELLKDASMTALPWRSASEKKTEMHTLVHAFSEEETREIQKLPGRCNATLNSILHALWGLLLAGHTGKKDIVFGTLTSGRTTEVAGIDRLTGCFVNAFPVRVEVRKEEPFGALARRVQTQILTSREYAWLPPAELGRALGREEGFFDHLLNYHNYQGASIADVLRKKMPGYTYLGAETYDDLSTGFCLYFDVTEKRLTCRFCYDANRFSEEWVRKLERAFVRMLRQLLADEAQSLTCGRIRVLETIPDQLAAREESEHTALICGEESLSYRQLASDAKHIARCLLERGLRRGDRVLLTVENSLRFVRAMFGVLLAGGAYVAADAKWPEERLRLVSEEAGVSVRLTDETIAEYMSAACRELPLPAVREEDEAAVYYTSGSTGAPKGTVLHHRLLLAHANPSEILQEYYERDRFVTFPVFTAITPLFLLSKFIAYEKTLIVLTPQEMHSADRLADCIIRNRAQSVLGTPSFLLRALEHPAFAEAVRRQVTHFGIGGEFLKASDCMKLYSAMENGALSSGYGSSETYLCAMSRYEPGKEFRLERFPRGVRLYVVDSGLKPVSKGEAGEVLAGGDCAKYWHYLDPELNRQKYIDHPLYGRCFRIGDAARLDADGRIILLGRIDHMIKLHGLRIEPGEVEAAMERFSGVRRAAVALKEGQLCGYYTAEREIDESGLRVFLSERLPYYMLPSVFIRMEAFPMSGNGKLDYQALPAPEKGARQVGAPENDRERLLCRVFGEVLKAGEPVGAEDSFFSLGGDSLRALMVMGELEKEGFSLELKDFFTAPTPRFLAPLLRVNEEGAERTDELTDGGDAIYPVTRHVAHRFRRRGAFYPTLLIGEIDASRSEASAERLRERAAELSEKHDALRSKLVTDGGGNPVQAVQKRPATEFFQVDLRKLSNSDGLSDAQKRYLAALTRMELSEKTELGGKVAFRLGHIRVSEEKAILFCGFSHNILDGIGVAAVLRELLGGEPVRPDRTLWQRRLRRLAGEDREQALAYWRAFFERTEPAVPFPAAENAAASGRPLTGRKKSYFVSGGRKLYEALKESCAGRGTSLSVLMTYAVGKALLKVQETDHALFYTVGAGRSPSEMKLPGMFTVSFPVCMKTEDSPEALQRQLVRSEQYAWIFGLPDAPLPFGDALLNLNVQNIPVPEGFRVVPPSELEDGAADTLWSSYLAVTDTPLEIQAYPDERFGFMGWCDTERYDAEALKTLLREALIELKHFSTDTI